MAALLVRVSMYEPVTHLTGPALAIEQQWQALYKTGWPEESGTWVGHPWLGLTIQTDSSGGYVLRLKHGEVVTAEDRFLVVCNAGRWQVKQYARGADGPWLEPAHEIMGQSGDLTPDLAAALLKAAASAKGPWFAQVATGVALAWQRVDEIYRARGLKPLPDPWKGAAGGITFTRMEGKSAEGQFLSGSLAVRFAKVDGLWKIANYTEGGKWLEAPDEVRIAPTGTVFDPPFGIMLGNTDAVTVEKRFGPPDLVKATDNGKVYVYSLRKLEVSLDSEGKVTSLSMKTGAPGSGVRIGSPVELWELIYGHDLDMAILPDQHYQGLVQGGRIVEIRLTSGNVK